MKKIIISAMAALAMAFSMGSAMAQTVEAKFSRDLSADTAVAVKQVTKFGTVDATYLNERHAKPFSKSFDRATGFELGYTNGVSVGAVNLTGRVAAGRLTGINDSEEITSFLRGNTRFVSLTGEAILPVSDTVAVFGNFRHRNFRGEDTPVQNRVQAGVEVRLPYSLTGRVGISHARQDREFGTGVLAQLGYSF